MGDLPKILYTDCDIGDFILQQDFCAAFEIVKAKDVMGPTLNQPDAEVMKCYWVSSKYPERSQFKPGEPTIDYFKHEFYGPYDKEHADEIIEKFQKDKFR